ncbi:MAG: hypothetical protein ACI9LV_000069 [Candidatus Nanohaloarchaea archaeon]|jgi:hypothetical protein
MTLTWARISVVLLFCIGMLGAASGSHYYGSHQEDVAQGYSIPEYDSQGELATELVAPFIAIAVILQFAFYKILGFTLAVNDGPFPNRGGERKRARKQSMLLSLVVTAMLIPSPFWGMIRNALQGLALVSIAGLFLVVLFLFYHMMSSGPGADSD